jgi:hypothetical protein
MSQNSMSTINDNTKESNFIESLTIFSKKYSCGTQQNYIHVNRSTCNFMFIKPKNSVNNEVIMSVEPVHAIKQEPVISSIIKNLYLIDFFKIGKKVEPDVFDDDSYSFTRIKEYESLVARIRSEYQKHAICDGVFNPDKYRFFEFCNLKNSYELCFIRIIGMYMKDHTYTISDYNREDMYFQNKMSSLFDFTIQRHFIVDRLMLKFIELELEFLKKILTELQSYAGNVTDCELTIRTTDIYADSIDELNRSLCEITDVALSEYF